MATADTKPTKRRKPSLGAALRQAARAGKSVKAAEVLADRVVLQFGEPDSAASCHSSWDEEIRKLKAKKRG
jgi:hypothetical protein